jgi:anti-sigma regulatory factor (Ser/Thr protein kinase)
VLSRALSRGGGGGHDPDPDGRSATIQIDLDSGPGAAAEARAALSLLEGRADPDSLDDVRLLVSELVTNSVRHAGARRNAKVGLAVSATPETLRVEVSDSGAGFEPIPRSASRTEAGGWGLHLVDRLSHRWGVDRIGRSSVVWFEIDAAG